MHWISQHSVNELVVRKLGIVEPHGNLLVDCGFPPSLIGGLSTCGRWRGQPGRIAEYVRRAISGGAGDDGLIQRFGLLIWPDQLPEWKSIDRHPNSDARDGLGCFVSFDSLDPGAVGANPTSPFPSVPVLRLDKEAHGLFLDWRKGWEKLLPLASHFAKYRKLNHLAEWTDQ